MTIQRRSGGRRGLLLLCLVLIAATMAFDASATDQPSFLIESIHVTGVSSRAVAIVVAESALKEGQSYDEAQLHAAMSRIRRLPFVLGCDFRMEKGSSAGRFVLVVLIRETKPLFVNADSTTRWESRDLYVYLPGKRPEVVGSTIDQTRSGQLALGARTFLGSKGMLNLVAERVTYRHDRYTLAFTEYDLFNTRASVTATVSYLQDPGARRSGDPNQRFDWHNRDNLTYEIIGVLPFGDSDSIRASWQHSEHPTAYNEVNGTQLRYVLLSAPEIRKDIFWIHDTTNDPLLPTSGTRITAGASKTSMPTSTFASVGRVNFDQYDASIESTWPLTSVLAATAGGSHHDVMHRVWIDRVFARASVDLWGRERTIRAGDLRLEIVADRHVQRVRGMFPHVLADSTIRAGLVYRSVWGVLRLDLEYGGLARSE